MRAVIALSLLFFVGCASHQLYQSFPKHFPEPIFQSNLKGTQKEMAFVMGKALFYDPILSANYTISCASCHSPYNAFAHTDHDLSHGIGDSNGRRNAPALFNLAWRQTFMWDGAIHHIEAQPLAPITNEKEMGSTLLEVLQRLNRSAFYKDLNQQAYGDSTVTTESMTKALATFQLELTSNQSKYDRVMQGEAHFTDQEAKGYAIYKSQCKGCHVEPLFTSPTFKSNGLPVDPTLNDLGRMEMTQDSKDSLLFQVPSLRNLSFTYPYMHDGRFERLSEVLKFYASGDKHEVSSPEMQEIHLDATMRVDLTAFLLTLNDTAFVMDERWGFPKIVEVEAKD